MRGGTPFLADRDLSQDSADPIEGTVCVPESDVQLTEKASYYILRALQVAGSLGPELIP
jgi:hypothetical protein